MTVSEMPKFKIDREPNEDEFMELVYNPDAAPIIFKHFPNAYFSDASDDIHDGRFQVILNWELDRNKFYTMMILEGFVRDCLCFELNIRIGTKQQLEEVNSWIKSADKLKNAGYVPQWKRDGELNGS